MGTARHSQVPAFDELVAYERGDLTLDETVMLFQRLIDSDMVRELQPYYLRTALALIDRGLCDPSSIGGRD